MPLTAGAFPREWAIVDDGRDFDSLICLPGLHMGIGDAAEANDSDSKMLIVLMLFRVVSVVWPPGSWVRRADNWIMRNWACTGQGSFVLIAKVHARSVACGTGVGCNGTTIELGSTDSEKALRSNLGIG